MRYYCINENKKDKEKWDVCLFHHVVIPALPSPDVAHQVAEMLNNVYRDGIRDGMDKVRDRLNTLLFTEDDL